MLNGRNWIDVVVHRFPSGRTSTSPRSATSRRVHAKRRGPRHHRARPARRRPRSWASPRPPTASRHLHRLLALAAGRGHAAPVTLTFLPNTWSFASRRAASPRRRRGQPAPRAATHRGRSRSPPAAVLDPARCSDLADSVAGTSPWTDADHDRARRPPDPALWPRNDWVVTLDPTRTIVQLGTSDQFVIPVMRHAAPAPRRLRATVTVTPDRWPQVAAATRRHRTPPVDRRHRRTAARSAGHGRPRQAQLRRRDLPAGNLVDLRPRAAPSTATSLRVSAARARRRHRPSRRHRPRQRHLPLPAQRHLPPRPVDAHLHLANFGDTAARGPRPDWHRDPGLHRRRAPPPTRSAPHHGTDGRADVTGLGGAHRRPRLDQRPALPRGPVPRLQRLRLDPPPSTATRSCFATPAARVIALGSPVRVGPTDIYRYASPAALAVGTYTVTFVAGSFGDTGGTANQAETETFTRRRPHQRRSPNPTSGARARRRSTSTAAAGSTSPSPAPTAASSSTGPAEFTITHAAPATRSSCSARRSGSAAPTPTATSSPATPSEPAARPSSGRPAGPDQRPDADRRAAGRADDRRDRAPRSAPTVDAIMQRTWLDVIFTPVGGTRSTLGTVNGDELAAIAGLTAGTATDTRCVQVDDTHLPLPVHRRPARRAPSTVTVLAGTLERHRRQRRRRQHRHVHADHARPVVLHRDLRRPPALGRRASSTSRCSTSRPQVVLEIDTARKLFTLTFDGQLKLYQARHGRRDLRPLRPRHGRRHRPAPRFWGVATLETNFSSLEQYGIFLFAKGTLQINTTGVDQARDAHPQGHRRRRHRPDPRPSTSSAEQLRARAASARRGSGRRARTTDLCGCRAASSSASRRPRPQMQMYATAELSFGVGDAQLTYGAATALL